MTTAVQHRRGTTAEHSTFTGLEGEVTIDTTKDTAVIHDGALAGGYPLAKENLNNANPATLGALDGASSAADDLFLVYDTSASQMKKMTRAELNNAVMLDPLDTVDINGGTIDGTAIGSASASTGAFTTLTSSSTTTLNGTTIPASVTLVSTAATQTLTNKTLTTPTISSPTVSDGTANGVAYLNGSKVLTTGSALTFDGTNLATTGDILLNNARYYYGKTNGGTNVRLLGINSGNSLYVGIDSGPSDMILNASSSSSNIQFLASGSEQMRLTSTGLGIGTSSPGVKLDVAAASGVVRVTSTTGTNGVYYQASNTGGGLYMGRDDSDGGSFYSGSPAYGAIFLSTGAYPMAFAIDSVERMRLDSSGNLGLGVTPSAWGIAGNLDGSNQFTWSSYDASIGSNYYFNSGAKYKASSLAVSRYQAYNGSHTWYTAPSGTAGNAISFTQAMTLDGNGLLYLQSAAPSLLIQPSTTTNNALLRSVNAGGTAYIGLDNSTGGLGGAYALNLWHSGAYPIVFANNNTERARIDSSGNLIQTVNTTAATLTTNQTLTFSIVDNSTLRISVRGSDGTTRTATIALS